MSFDDVFRMLRAKQRGYSEVSLFASRWARLRRAHRFIPPNHTDFQAFWSEALKLQQLGKLSTNQFNDLQANIRFLKNACDNQRAGIGLILDSTRQGNVKELALFDNGLNAAANLSFKAVIFSWDGNTFFADLK